MEACKRDDDVKGQVNALAKLSTHFYDRNNYDLSMNFLHVSIELSERTGDLEGAYGVDGGGDDTAQAEAFRGLGRCERALGHEDEASRCFSHALSLTERTKHSTTTTSLDPVGTQKELLSSLIHRAETFEEDGMHGDGDDDDDR